MDNQSHADKKDRPGGGGGGSGGGGGGGGDRRAAETLRRSKRLMVAKNSADKTEKENEDADAPGYTKSPLWDKHHCKKPPFTTS